MKRPVDMLRAELRTPPCRERIGRGWATPQPGETNPLER